MNRPIVVTLSLKKNTMYVLEEDEVNLIFYLPKKYRRNIPGNVYDDCIRQICVHFLRPSF